VHGLIFLFLLLMILHTPMPPFEDNAGGMTVNFGTDDVGTGDEQPFTYNPAPVESSPSAASKSSPAESAAEDVISQENEETEVVVPKPAEKPKPKVDKNAIFKPTPKPTNVKETTPKNTTTITNTTPAPKADPNAMFKKGAYGQPNNSKGDGEGGGQGDQGKPTGDPNSRNYLGDGSGNGSGPGTGDLNGGYSLKGRKKVTIPSPQACSSRGKVVIAIKVDRSGRVVDAKFRRFESTVFDECNVNNAMQAARRATFNPDANAQETQEGTITYINKVQ